MPPPSPRGEEREREDRRHVLLALGGMVVSGPGIAQVGIVGAAFSLVACALVVLTLWLARREGIRG